MASVLSHSKQVSLSTSSQVIEAEQGYGQGWEGSCVPLPGDPGTEPMAGCLHDGVLEGWESRSHLRCSPGPPEGSTGAHPGLPGSIVGRFEQWFPTPGDWMLLFLTTIF